MNPERCHSLPFPSDRGGRERRGVPGTAAVLLCAQAGASGGGGGSQSSGKSWIGAGVRGGWNVGASCRDSLP